MDLECKDRRDLPSPSSLPLLGHLPHQSMVIAFLFSPKTMTSTDHPKPLVKAGPNHPAPGDGLRFDARALVFLGSLYAPFLSSFPFHALQGKKLLSLRLLLSSHFVVFHGLEAVKGSFILDIHARFDTIPLPF